ALKNTSKSIHTLIEDIKGPVPPDKWKQKLAKLEAQRQIIQTNAISLSNLSKAVKTCPVLGPEQGKLINDHLAACQPPAEQAMATIKDKISKLRMRKTLTPEQDKELIAFQAKVEMAEKTYISQIRLVWSSVKEKITTKQVKIKK